MNFVFAVLSLKIIIVNLVILDNYRHVLFISINCTVQPLMDSMSLVALDEKQPTLNYLRGERWCSRFRYSIQELKSRILTLPAALLILYTLPSVLINYMIYDIASDFSVPPEPRSCYECSPEVDEKVRFWVVFVIQSVLYSLIPFFGWASDAKLGRRLAIELSLWAGWFGTLLQTLSECFQYYSCGTIEVVGKYAVSSVALIFLMISVAMFYANVLAFGMDQLISHSTTKVRSFIYWYTWMLFFSGNTVSVTGFLSIVYYYVANMSVSFISFFLFSVSLCFQYWYYEKMEVVKCINPYKMVYKILKYAIYHKYPMNRSAFSYWENTVPSRIDLAKAKYGGPYCHEKVENVKTFFRILLVLLVFSPFLISSDPVINHVSSLIPLYKNGLRDFGGLASYIIFFVGDSTILLAIPLLEFIMLPLFPKLEYILMNPLKGLGLSQVLIILAIFLTLLFDVVGRLKTGSNVPCFTVWMPEDSSINLSYWAFIVPSLLSGIADNVSFLCVFEFVCSQSPFEMNGMLIGLFWLIRSICISFSSIISLTLENWNLTTHAKLSCTSWFMIILGMVSIFGLLIYIPVARSYVKRIRNDELNLRASIEHHFEQQLINETKERKKAEQEYISLS